VKLVDPNSIPVEIVREEDGSGFYAYVPSLPGCFSQGDTVEEAELNIREAIQLHLESLADRPSSSEQS